MEHRVSSVDGAAPAKIIHIFTSPGHDFKGRHGRDRKNHGVLEHQEAHCVAGKGLVGDRYFGQPKHENGQITFFSSAVARAARRRFEVPRFSPSVFRRNVIVDGPDLGALIGHEFELGGIRFVGTEECTPCYWMDRALVPGTEEFLKGRGGLRARVLTTGPLRTGATDLVILGAARLRPASEKAEESVR